jgi:protease-4
MNMKDFMKWVLAVLLGLFVWGIIKVILFFMMFGSMAASAESFTSGSAPVIPKEGYLLMDMSKIMITDKEQPSMDLNFGSTSVCQISLLNAVDALKTASEDPGIKFLLLKTDFANISLSGIEELRKALTDFRKSGKAIIAYGESFTSGTYFLASVADKIYSISHDGGSAFMTLNGVSARMMFFGDLMKKLGVNIQFIRHGKYKSAGETFYRNSPSPENEAQYQEMINSTWKTICDGTSESRGIPVDSINAIADNLLISCSQDLVDHKLADEVLSLEEFKDKIAEAYGAESYTRAKAIRFEDYTAAKVKRNTSAKKKIAIIYAEGNIVEGDDPDNIPGDRYASLIARVRMDSTVKAVVFRVNSPGGTVLAASKIKEEIDAMRKVKPVIASYGSYAASGGYWISNSCDRIFSDATTLTGSIGVFSMIPDFSKTANDLLHINIATIKSNKHTDMYSGMRPLDETETAWMQKFVDTTYEEFVSIVAEGRDLTTAAVDSIAQGRVWTGADALEIGLVDEIGGLTDALAYAAKAAGDEDLESWNIASYPKPKSRFEQILEQLGMKSGSDEDVAAAIFKGTIFENEARNILNWSRSWLKESSKEPVMMARMPYIMEIK